MGKRKERRHAAKTNAGRRFKLDLFAEPSTGDLGGSSVEDEVEVDKEPKKPGAGSPSSPSTSGKPENPLLLLGQYSDEDSEVDSDKKPGDKPTGEASFPGNKDEIGASKGDGQTDDESNTEEVKQHKIDTFIASLDIKQDPENTDTGKENNDTRGSIGDPEQNGDAGSNWQTVMHEESNQYYYWNVVTGETSWVIPEVVAREAEVSANHITPETADSVFPTHNPSLNSVECNGGGTEEDGNNANLSNDHVNYGSADASLDENPVKSDSEKFVDELGIDLLSNCERHCESLLQRLKSVHRPKNESLDCIAKYALEVEIRLSDIKALSAFGSSLHHYWAHSEMQLKRLADSINLEIYKLAQTSLIEDTPREITDLKPETNGTENKDSSPIPKEQTLVISKDQSLASPTNEQNISHHLRPDEDDDVDMDVDMEVEDSSSDDVEKSVAEESSEPIHPAEPPHEMTVPPPLPPDDEWVPPPPPDSDNIPPPLPDDLPVPYVDSYNLSYPDPNFAYYSQAGTRVIATGNFYGQVAEAPIYYSGGIPSTHPEAANHIVPVSYYDFQDGGVPPVPGVSGTEAAQFQGEPTLITYGNLASDSTGSALISAVEAGHTTTIEASPVVVEQESVLLPSTNPVSVVPETKCHTKVARTKKRANAVPTTSRPSKKVSNLVNKWKAAKEELLEEEPQTAYEMLERKRQKEIEEWRAQQIASGEAKANANFQPLGGDWRERVKRRRAQKAKEGAESQTSPEEHKDEESNSQLTELSKGLPTGWKVYFDASSKQVYYGNTVTSETSWTRPTK